MSLPQGKIREIVFQLLYSFDFVQNEDHDIVDLLSRQLKVSKKNLRNALERKNLIAARMEAIDEAIEKYSKEYELSRIPKVELNVLRVAIFELLFDQNVPAKVAISEGMRLARKFATKESMSFINAVLDAIFKEPAPV